MKAHTKLAAWLVSRLILGVGGISLLTLGSSIPVPEIEHFSCRMKIVYQTWRLARSVSFPVSVQQRKALKT